MTSYNPPPSTHARHTSGGTKSPPNPLDWVIFVAAVLALIFSFFSFYTYNANGPAKDACGQSGVPAEVNDLCSGDTASAWHGFFGWFGVVLVLIAAFFVAVAVFDPRTSLQVPPRFISVGIALLGVISLLIAIPVVPDWPPLGGLGSLGVTSYSQVIDNGNGFSYWIVLILAIIVTALCGLRWTQTGRQLPGKSDPTRNWRPPTPH
jgi:hypothetical protein